MVGTFTWITAAAGDLNSEQQHGFLRHHVYGSFSPNNNLNFPQNPTLTFWVAIAGRKNVLDNPMTGRPSGVMAR